ncbi:hypothetical protein SAMN05216436_10369 [bacterium A37T11]|nr:hypothetical protein SAMN05216436_10369 [bacterium A37T11]
MTTMTTLTVNIKDRSSEQAAKAFLDKMGLEYSIGNTSEYNWWEDSTVIADLDKRSDDLKSGKDKGYSFADIKQELLNR